MAAGSIDTLRVGGIGGAAAAGIGIVHDAGLDLRVAGRGDIVVAVPEDAQAAYFPRFSLPGGDVCVPIRTVPTRPVRIRWAADGPVDSVHVFGSMNAWNRNDLALADPDGDGTWERTLHLEPGRYPYLLRVDGREIVDPNAVELVPNGFGGFNGIVAVDLPPPGPRLRVGHWWEGGDGVAMSFHLDPLGGADDEEVETILLWDRDRWIDPPIVRKGRAIWLRLDERVSPGWRDGLHTIRVMCRVGSRVSNVIRLDTWNGRPAGEQQGFRLGPPDWRDAVIYQVFVDRFRNGDLSNDAPSNPRVGDLADWQGGDLAGLERVLGQGYLDSLSIDALWLTPLQVTVTGSHREAPEPHRRYTGYHGYWPTVAREVDSRFGSLPGLARLVEAAHGRDMSILLDLVAHHVHEDHPIYVEYPQWFGRLTLEDGSLNIRRWDSHRLTTWFDRFLPTLEYRPGSEVSRRMAADARWWLEESGADGFRHDATKHVPHHFWRYLTGVLGDLERDVFQVGETFGDDRLVRSFVHPEEMDSQFDFETYYVSRRAILDPAIGLETLARRLERAWDRFGSGHRMGTIVGSHDQVRFVSMADGSVCLEGGHAEELAWVDPPGTPGPKALDQLADFFSLVVASPGIPVVYYGDEIGLPGAADPDNRRFMRWHDQWTDLERAQLDRTRKILAFRREHVALRRGDFEVLHANHQQLVFLRAHPLEAVVFVLHRGDEPGIVPLHLPPGFRGTVKDIETGEVFEGSVPMDASAVRFLLVTGRD